MSRKTLVVFGATGQQGGAVVKKILEDQYLSKDYTVRAVVRDPLKPAAQALGSAGCEVVQGDLDDPASLRLALTGADCAFLVTSSVFDDRLYERELAQGKAVADAAIEAGLENLIFSTLPSVRKISNGRYTKVWHFDAKYDIEQYIRGLPIKSAFVALGSFMQNLENMLKPTQQEDESFVIATSMAPGTRLPMVDARDVAVFVAAILQQPEVHEGKVLYASSGLYSLDEMARIISEVNGKEVRYKQLPEAEFRNFLEALNPIFAEDFREMAAYYQEYGYFGPETAKLIQPAVEGIFGPLTALRQFVKEMKW